MEDTETSLQKSKVEKYKEQKEKNPGQGLFVGSSLLFSVSDMCS